jgi:general secretion pathway protein D
MTLGLCRIALLALALSHSAAQAQAGGITLNLKDADIRTLIETVSEATGRNFVIDPRVKAKVTVVSSRPMNKADLYQVFLSILQVHGYSAVQVGDVTKIVPDVNAKQGPVPVTEPAHPGNGDELVTRVIKVENVPAAQLVPILRPLIPQQGHLAAYAASNNLVVSDRAGNVERIIKIIKRIDVPDSQEIEVIPLEHASAAEVVRIITALNQKDAKRAKVPGQPILAADERTNSVLLGGDRTARLRIRGLIAHLDTPLEGGGNTQVVFLKFADAEELAPVLLGVAQQQAEAATKPAAAQATTTTKKAGQEIDIQADPRNNALIITASPAQFNRLRSVIQQLDIRRSQVLVESIIAEVNTDLSKDLGVEFAVIPTEEGGASPAAVSNAGSGTGGLVDIANSIIGGGNNPFSLAAGLFVGAADLSGSTRWAILVRALAGDAATNILSTPTLVTMDNEEAQIVVGQNVPFITGSFTQTGTDATNPFQTIERQDVGLTLNITPQINEGDTIKLTIEQETSSLSASAATLAASDLITNKRQIKTSVLVEDDQILVLGGLIQDEFQDTVQKTPVLGDIPILGRLFRFDSTKKTKQNLMVFIHPVILQDEAIANAYTNRKYGYLRAQQLEADMQNRGLISEGVTRLPDLDDLITTIPEDEKRRFAPHDPDEFLDMTP